MTIFEAGDIVRTLFPHVERLVLVPRPALVITSVPIGPSNLLIWVLMITNAARSPWPGDIAIPDAETLGLLIPSKIRTAKVTTVETATTSLIGRAPHLLANVRETLAAQLGLRSA